MNSSDETGIYVHKPKSSIRVWAAGCWGALGWFFAAKVLLGCYSLCAGTLPPLGVTVVDPRFPAGKIETGLSIISDTVYISQPGRGVWGVTAIGANLIDLSRPGGGLRSPTTSVVAGPDGKLYVGGRDNSNTSSSLFRLDAPTAPLVTWDRHPVFEELSLDARIAGIDRNLQVLGDIRFAGSPIETGAVRFNLDGTLTGWESDYVSFMKDVSLNGYSVGFSTITGGIGSVAALWSPEGELTSLGHPLPAISVADRLDGAGVNVGFEQTDGELRSATILYGEHSYVELEDADGRRLFGDTYVGQSEFAIINLRDGGVYGYYPRLVPGKPEAALPIQEIFPELADVDFDFISKPYALDGNVYMALTGNDGLVLFGAVDPSLVPEPMAITLLLGAWLLLVGVRRRSAS